jgi:hypothetical protein
VLREGQRDGFAELREPGAHVAGEVHAQRAAAALRACAALTVPKLYFAPGTCRSAESWQVTCRNTPLFGPPL